MEGFQVAALEAMTAAVNAGDASGYAGLYTPDAEIRIYGSGDLYGRPAIERHEVELLRAFPGTRLAFYSLWKGLDSTAVHYAVNGPTPEGRLMGHEGLLFHRFHRSGLIEQERRYMDALTPMAQVGLLGSLPARPLPNLPEVMRVYAGDSPGDVENVRLVKTWLVALDERDESRLSGLVAADILVDDLIFPEPFIGKSALEAWVDAWNLPVADARLEITTILSARNAVVVETVLRGTLNGSLCGVSAFGKPFAVHRAAIFETEGPTILAIRWFMNRRELAEAVGQRPPFGS